MDFLAKNIRLILETINQELKRNGKTINVKKIRKYHNIPSTDRSQISFISHTLRLLEKKGLLSVKNGVSPKMYHIMVEAPLNRELVFTYLTEQKVHYKAYSIPFDKDKSKKEKISGIPMDFIEEILSQIQDVEDLLDRINVLDFYSNKEGVNTLFQQHLGSICKLLSAIFLYAPDLQDLITKNTEVDFLRMGKIIEAGYWHANYKNGWNAIQAIGKAKELLLNYLEE